MRLIFMGTPDFAVPSLRILHEAGYDIAAVVTAPDRKRGRGQKLSFTPVKEYAVAQGIPVLQPDSLKDEAFQTELTSCKADCFVIVAFRILPEAVFSIPPRGSFNLHASLLPRYRGAAPLNWALMHGDTETGVTTFFLKQKVDTGSIILQERFPISEDMTAGELHDGLSELGAHVVLRTVSLIEKDEATAQPQDDTAATPAPKIFRDTCAIPWQKSARDVHNHVRGLSPFPGAWTMFHGKQLNILCSIIAEEKSVGAPGTVIDCTAGITVQCGSGSIRILELKPEGKKRMSVDDYLRGYKVVEGETMTNEERGSV
jgi:methionyl-tRNA formyltransferase